MAILNNSNAISSGGYDINNSVRLRNSATAYFNKTNSASAPTNNKIGTISFWIKRGVLGAGTGNNQYMMETGTGTSDSTFFNFLFTTSDTISLSLYSVEPISTTQVFRDPSAWYHFVVAFDSTQATGSNRMKFYINGSEATGITRPSDVPLNTNFAVLNASQVVNIGRHTTVNRTLDGYLAEFNIIDGQALTPSSFGETDTTTGSWKPKAYTGTYGNKGVYLKFSDIATTSGSNAGLGKDFSGNANYWTTNNISVTAGTTYDAMTDVPTNTSATVANYATFNPLSKTSSNATFSNANLTVTHSNNLTVDTTIGVQTGKYYCELTVSTISTRIEFGVAKDLNWAVNYRSDGQKNVNGTVSAYGATWTTGDVIGIAFDIASATATFYKNNVSQGQITGITYYSDLNFITTYGSTVPVYSLNFGQRPFSYTPPTGFVALNTYNLPDSTIKKGNTVMDATLYTGTGATQVITNAASFKPDFVWCKGRSNAENHALFDSVRGVNKNLASNTTAIEGTQTDMLMSFNSNGFTLGADGNWQVNKNATTYVGWNWQAGQGTNTTNTAGTVTSTVSVNTTAGFSIVLYTGNGGAMTMGHGLGVAPKLIILKDRDIGRPWPVYHGSLATNQYLILNTTAAAATSTSYWNNTAPTSTVFSVNGLEGNVGANGEKYVAYCWADVSGFSKAFSYTGNGSSDGPFTYLGFRPKFILIKGSSAAGNPWYIVDSSRNTYNIAGQLLEANSSAAESTYDFIDFLSNGFKIRNTGSGINGSGATFIGMAFAENPFKNSLAR